MKHSLIKFTMYVTKYIEVKIISFYPLISSYYARVPLNGGWGTTSGMRTTV
jgi:hypothetical protein